jgi:phenylpropionate dioxygenase-like ring-hydroxylating dioxygenase large terminal subunit
MDYLNNAWYVLAAAPEVSRTPMRRVMLDVPVVLYRTEAGEPVALLDRCPHRFAPLSKGSVTGDHLQCRYHGLQFSREGLCVHNPHAGPTPRAATVRPFPALERYGFVWVWPGAPAQADPALVPDLHPFGEPGMRTRSGCIAIPADYRLVIDNLLDLSHVEFLHPSFKSEGSLESTRHEVREEGGVVHSNRWKHDCLVSPMLRQVWQREVARGDARSCIRWHAPSNLFLDIGATEVGAPVEAGVSLSLLHLLTPERADRTHYFWAVAWDRRHDAPGLADWLEQVLVDAFEREDEPMIAAQHDNIGRDVDLMSLAPALLQTDVAAVKARRVLQRAIDEERAGAAAAPAPAAPLVFREAQHAR